MKYIVLKVEGKDGFSFEVPFVFTEMQVHAIVAQAMIGMFKITHPECRSEAISAGMFSSTEFGGGCGGISTSLNLKSRGSVDDRLLTMNDYGVGFL